MSPARSKDRAHRQARPVSRPVVVGGRAMRRAALHPSADPRLQSRGRTYVAQLSTLDNPPHIGQSALPVVVRVFPSQTSVCCAPGVFGNTPSEREPNRTAATRSLICALDLPCAGGPERAICARRATGSGPLRPVAIVGGNAVCHGRQVQPNWTEATISSRAARSCGEVSGENPARIM